MKKKKIIIITGPTASGKSGLALDVAKKIKGEVLNADAFQVYQGLQILTARPSVEEMRGIPHHLYGYVDNFSQENVSDWVKKAATLLSEIDHPVVVGGTGLYLSVLTEGISPIPDISPEIRRFVRQMPPEQVVAQLKEYKIPLDIQRQRRALEVLLETKHPIEYFQNLPKQKFLNADFDTFVLMPEREELYARIERRLVQMVEAGVVEEVRNLLNSSASGGVLNAIGVKELTDFIEKKCDLPTALERVLLATRHYAKRQRTWFRHQMPTAKLIQNPTLKDVITK